LHMHQVGRDHHHLSAHIRGELTHVVELFIRFGVTWPSEFDSPVAPFGTPVI
jgi:hypothetical protein